MTSRPHGPTVSVLLPVWNGERYLADAIDSVLAQTFADFELIVVDDGSNDGSGALIRRYRDRRIQRIENEKNLGVTRSLNLATARARGRYLARMDADDRCAPERFERQVAFLDAHPRVALVASRARRIDAHGSPLGVLDTPVDGEWLRRRLRLGNCIVHGSVMLRADAVRALGGYDEAMERAEDYDLWLRLAQLHAVAALPDLLYDWRDHGEGVGQRHHAEQEAATQRVQLAARRRFSAALVGELLAGEVSAEHAAWRALDLVREEDTVRTPRDRVTALVASCARRAPRLHARWYRLRNRRALAELRGDLRAAAAGRLSRDAACAAIVACVRALDPGRA
jgi:hypothetical protein